jgi:uncharacterized protein
MDRKIRLYNPWWEENRIPPELYSENTFFDFNMIEELLENKKVLAIMGSRQIGKTYLLYYIIDHLFKRNVPPKNILFLSMDDRIINLDTALSYYEKIILKKDIQSSDDMHYIFLDEIQLFNDWEDIIRHYIEESYPVKFILSSSSKNHLKSWITAFEETYYTEINIMPMYFPEYLLTKKISYKLPDFNLDDLYNTSNLINNKVKFLQYQNQMDMELHDFILQGGYYRYVKEPNPLIRTQKIMSQIIDLVIFKDINIIYNVGKPDKIEDLLLYIARNIGSLFQFDYLSKLFNLTYQVLDNYINYLESAFLVNTTYNYCVDHQKNQIIPKKVYFADLGIRNSIVGEQSINVKDINNLIDNSTFLHFRHIQKKYQFEIYYWRKDTYDIDIVLKYKNELLPIQINYLNKQQKTVERNMNRFLNELNCRKGIVITKDVLEQVEVDGKEILMLPAWIMQLIK